MLVAIADRILKVTLPRRARAGEVMLACEVRESYEKHWVALSRRARAGEVMLACEVKGSNKKTLGRVSQAGACWRSRVSL